MRQFNTFKYIGAAVPFYIEEKHETEEARLKAQKENQDSCARSVMGVRATKTPNGCIIWNGTFDKDNRPIRVLHGTQENVRSVIFRIYNPGNAGKSIYNICGDYRCIAPQCSSLSRRIQTGKEKLEKFVETETGCHIFASQKNRGGKVARFKHNGHTVIARRASYEAHNGQIPKGWTIKNTCKNPLCFNPRHLRGVPPAAQRLFRESRPRIIGIIESTEGEKGMSTSETKKVVVQRILDKCTRDGDGHLIFEWRGSANRSPVIKVDGVPYFVRPELYKDAYPEIQFNRIYPQCGVELCVDPKCASHEKAAKTFMDKLKNFKLHGPKDCHVAMNYCDKNEYHEITCRGITMSAHRAIFEYHNGPIPEGMQIHHLCNNKACYRIDHLKLVTPLENIRLAIEDGLFTGVKTRGAAHGNTSLPDPEVIYIRELFRQKFSVSAIAGEYDISTSHVRHIGKRMARDDAKLIHYTINSGRTMAPFELLFKYPKESETFMVIEGHNGCTFYARTASDSSWWSADYPAYPYLKKILSLQAA
jgi:hypothetical protein